MIAEASIAAEAEQAAGAADVGVGAAHEADGAQRVDVQHTYLGAGGSGEQSVVALADQLRFRRCGLPANFTAPPNEYVEDTGWFIYPTGVFLKGTFALMGRLFVRKNSLADITDVGGGADLVAEQYEYRPADVMNVENNLFVFRGRRIFFTIFWGWGN